MEDFICLNKGAIISVVGVILVLQIAWCLIRLHQLTKEDGDCKLARPIYRTTVVLVVMVFVWYLNFFVRMRN